MYTVCPICPETERSVIESFWARLIPTWQRAKLPWLYLNNPAGAARVWLCRYGPGDGVAGVTAAFPHRLFWRGQPVTAAITGDFAVAADHRCLGPALKLQRSLVAEARSAFELLYGTPNDRSSPVQKVAGFRKLGRTVRLVRLVRSEPYVSRFVSWPPVRRILSSLVDTLLYLRGLAAWGYHPWYSREILDCPDERFDRLGESYRNLPLLVGDRGSAFVRWRFSACPHRRYRIFAVSRRSTGKLVGYVIYSVSDGVVAIDDMVFTENGFAVVGLFVLHVMRTTVRSLTVEYFGDERVIRTLRRHGFRRRPGGRDFVVFIRASSTLHEAAGDPANWRVFEADNA